MVTIGYLLVDDYGFRVISLIIIWINGPFGVGKSSLARHLSYAISKSFVFVPGQFGHFIWKQVPIVLHEAEFEDEPVWRSSLQHILYQLVHRHGCPIIVPMTLVKEDSWHDIIQTLRERDVLIKHYSLIANRQAIVRRLIKRGELPNGWEHLQIDRCLDALS